MSQFLLRWVLRLAHAWAWTAAWLLILTHWLLRLPMDVGFAGVVAVLFTPLVYLPWLAWQAGDRDADLAGKLLLGAGSAWTLVGCGSMSFLLLAFFNFLGHWDKPGPSAGAALFMAVALHGLGMLSIGLGERWLGLKGRSDD